MKIHLQPPFTPLPLPTPVSRPEGWTADVLAQEELASVAHRRPLQTRRRIGTSEPGAETEASERTDESERKTGDKLDFLA